MWLQPKAVFYPLDNIKLEAGLHLLRYWGANKYPSFAYTDIAKWKGNQYQSGVHLLPIFRVQVALSDHLDLILGTIYGGANHRLIDPLYNPELNLSADPESGLQLKYTSKVLDLDTWKQIPTRRHLHLGCRQKSNLIIRMPDFIFTCLSRL